MLFAIILDNCMNFAPKSRGYLVKIEFLNKNYVKIIDNYSAFC